MSEQMRIRRPVRSERRRQQSAQQAEPQDTDTGTFDAAAREQLSRLDAALDEYLLQTSAADDSVSVGQPQAHLLARPLSNEALVRGFRQTRGE